MRGIKTGSSIAFRAALGGLLAIAGSAQAQTQASAPPPAYEVPAAVPSAPAAPPAAPAAVPAAATAPAESAPTNLPTMPSDAPAATPASMPAPAAPASPAPAPLAPATSAAAATPANTHDQAALMSAAEGVFGKGAKGLADMLEKILKDQGQPNAYIAGREVSGALLFGVRYGSGTMVHKVEGQRPVYWTGPSLGVDAGGDATKTFVLVYNLYDSQDLYQRYAQVEGRAYFIGGLSATYMRRGDVVIIPIRTGVGMRLGANVGYMKFSEKAKWLPF
ncbi:MAG: DUF1134 domain-containing protein [Alphaproteobacteria bacterium]|nr:DUF1134 domain-containing protein [Alphaproteobacteria bacterium]